jgi:mRNA interferase RelE/StbE
VTASERPYELRVTGPVQRQLERLPAGTAAAIVEFMVTALIENPHRVGGELQRELVGLHSAGRGAYRVIYEIDEIDDDLHVVIVLRVDHRSGVYRTR